MFSNPFRAPCHRLPDDVRDLRDLVNAHEGVHLAGFVMIANDDVDSERAGIFNLIDSGDSAIDRDEESRSKRFSPVDAAVGNSVSFFDTIGNMDDRF